VREGGERCGGNGNGGHDEGADAGFHGGSSFREAALITAFTQESALAGKKGQAA
jgi:hypothetical protein